MIQLEIGAWYKGNDDYHNIFLNRKQPIKNSYFTNPQRCIGIENDYGLFSTLGCENEDRGEWWIPREHKREHKKYLIKVKDPDSEKGKQYKIKPHNNDIAYLHLQRYIPTVQDVGKTFTASHESFSGVCIWLHKGADYIIVPRRCLNHVTPKIKSIQIGPAIECNNDLHFGIGHTVSVSAGTEMFNIDSISPNVHRVDYKPAIKDLERKIKSLEYKLSLSEEKISETMKKDQSNLENSMVLDLDPELAKLIDKAGIGREDLEEIIEQKASIVQELMRQRFIILENNMWVGYQEMKNLYAEQVLVHRHSTYQVAIKWWSVIATVMYVTHVISTVI